jgi:hypothetical protein
VIGNDLLLIMDLPYEEVSGFELNPKKRELLKSILFFKFGL